MMLVDKLHFVIMPPLSSRSMPLPRREAEAFVQWALPTIPMVNILLSSSLIVTIGNYSKQHVNLALFCANALID